MPKLTHASLKTQIMLELQKIYLSRLVIQGKSVGLAYFKRGDKYVGPYKMGNKGDSDIYGSLSFLLRDRRAHAALSFNIEVKVGKDKLSEEQILRQKRCKEMGALFVEGRSVEQVAKEFDFWDKQIRWYLL